MHGQKGKGKRTGKGKIAETISSSRDGVVRRGNVRKRRSGGGRTLVGVSGGYGGGSLSGTSSQQRDNVVEDASPSFSSVSSDEEGNGKRARAWCFTINNPVGVDVLAYELEQPASEVVFAGSELTHLAAGSVFMVCQLERGQSGTPHFQGYVYLAGRGKTLSAIKKLSPRANFRIARGTAEQNVAYCSKGDGRIAGPWTMGTVPHQGARNDLEHVCELLSKGSRISTVASSAPVVFVKYHRGLGQYAALVASKAMRPKPRMYYIWGPTGTGKTTEVRDCFHDIFYKNIKTSKTSPDWWDGYDGHETIVWDEFYGNCSWSFLLKLDDDTPLCGEVKGGFIYLKPKDVIFISNVPPQECFPNLYREDPRKFSALVRRLLCFHKKGFNKIEFYDLRMIFGKSIVDGAGGLASPENDPCCLRGFNLWSEEEVCYLYANKR